MSRAIRFAPLIVLLAIIAALVWRLATPADTEVHSTLDGKPVPVFDLGEILPSKPGLSSRDLATGQPHLVNVFASWCVPCKAEAPQLMGGDRTRNNSSITGAETTRAQEITSHPPMRCDISPPSA